MSRLNVIWFRQDLRVHDHAALRAACHAAEHHDGEVLALFILPRGETVDPAAPSRAFLLQSIRDLRQALEQRGAALHLRYGPAIDVFSDLHRNHGLASIHSHELAQADKADREIEAWAMRAGVPFRIYEQFGPKQAGADLFDEDSSWERFMSKPRHEAPDIRGAADVGIGPWPDIPVQDAEPEGGRKQAIRILRAFLGAPERGAFAQIDQFESGIAAFLALRPYLKLGVLSVREVWQSAISAHQQYAKAGYEIRAAAIASLLKRLSSLHLDKSHADHARGLRAAPEAAEKPTSQQAPDGPGTQMTLGFSESKRA